jgi:signal transduction histidine kinase/AmiR/NasT family two-component response regulator
LVTPSAGGTIGNLTVTQEVVSGDNVLREHLLRVALLYPGDAHTVTIEPHEVLVTGARTDVPSAAGRPLPLAVIPNHDDLAVGKLALDEATLRFAETRLEAIPDGLLRQLTWMAIYELVRDGRYLGVGAGVQMLQAGSALYRQKAEDMSALARDLAAAEAEARASSRAKSEFLAVMSHEIRTPLNGVLAMTEVMAMDELSARQRERLSVIRESGGLLLAVLNDVLDLSKIEAGRLELVERDFDLSSLAASLRETFVDQARDKGLDFGVMVAPEALGSWRGDVDRLRQILNNLVSNALKFTLEGAVSVRFASAEDGSGLRIDVTDTGIGIAADTVPRLFDKFVQADSSTTRRFGGSGLGLSICRELAAVMGGGIHVQSREGQGSTFTVVVAMPRGQGEVPLAAPVAVEAGDDVAPRRLRVLAADDNLTNQKVIAAVLAPLGAEVALVADGAACVEAWRAGGHDVILMDIHMPVMDGVEAARTIRSLEKAEGRPRTPIVAVTANALVHQVEGYLAAGMDGHVAKPIEVTKLYAAIEDAVASAARLSAAEAA